MSALPTENAFSEAAPHALSVEELLYQMAALPTEQFTIPFRRLCRLFRRETAQACVRFLAAHGAQGAGEPMRTWLCRSSCYVEALLHPDVLSLDAAKRLLGMFRDRDPHFYGNFYRAAQSLETPCRAKALRRALALLQGFEDYDVMIPWLRSLTQHPDEQVRSKAVKLLCRARPNRSLLEQQLEREDSRVRANALEAVWGVKIREAEQFFLEALGDTSHRVVANALVGLYQLGNATAFERMVAFTKHPSPKFRSAMIWAFTQLRDPRAVPVLQDLQKEESPLIRAKATRALYRVAIKG